MLRVCQWFFFRKIALTISDLWRLNQFIVSDWTDSSSSAIKNSKVFFVYKASIVHPLQQFISMATSSPSQPHFFQSIVCCKPARRKIILLLGKKLMECLSPITLETYFCPLLIFNIAHTGNLHSPLLVGESTFTIQSLSLYSPQAIPCCHLVILLFLLA